MKKYLRCHTSGDFAVAGKRYEVTTEDERCYYVKGCGYYTKEPDRVGKSYRDWFTLETEESENITVLPDESLGGVQREYREVKRKALVGERIKITAGRSAMLGEDFEGGVFSVINTDNYHAYTDGKWADGSTLNPSDDDYVVLEPTDILRIDGARFRMVDRKAAVGERIIVTKYGSAVTIGEIIEVDKAAEIREHGINFVDGYRGTHGGGEYRVLEPVESAPLSAQPPLDQAAATIGALQAQIQALESRVSTLEKAAKVYARILDDSREEVAE